MRLLHTSSYELHEFVGSNMPEYAILSHTWEEEEVLFADLRDPSSRDAATRKNGWRKILGACRHAREDGLDWIWIDTCCINKESSAELSEAINSMFRYYSNSFVCYAYLSDYFVREDGYPDMEPGSASLGKCRWFTRGWTLQELLAPLDLVFFDAEWEDMGTKYSLREVVGGITRIPCDVLVDQDIRSFSIAARMSWAADRQTTREEDRAYSLMGIFDVNIPPLYGEGGTKAFMRLQEEILKYSDDHSIFAWHAPFDPKNPKIESTGLLARSPSEFRDSGDVRASPKTGHLKSPYSMTNSGLRIHLPLNPVPDFLGYPPDLFTAQLCCQLGNNIGRPVVLSVYLQKVDRQGYIRWRPDCLLKDRRRNGSDVKEIYVRDSAQSHRNCYRLRSSKTLYSKSQKPDVEIFLKDAPSNSRETYHDPMTGKWFVRYSLYDMDSPQSTYELCCGVPGATDPMILHIRGEKFWNDFVNNIHEPHNMVAERDRLQPYLRDQIIVSLDGRDEEAFISVRKILVQKDSSSSETEVGCRLQVKSIPRKPQIVLSPSDSPFQSQLFMTQKHPPQLTKFDNSNDCPKLQVIRIHLDLYPVHNVGVFTAQCHSWTRSAITWKTERDWHHQPDGSDLIRSGDYAKYDHDYTEDLVLTQALGITQALTLLLLIFGIDDFDITSSPTIETDTSPEMPVSVTKTRRHIAVMLEILRTDVVWYQVFPIQCTGGQKQILQEAEEYWRSERQGCRNFLLNRDPRYGYELVHEYPRAYRLKLRGEASGVEVNTHIMEEPTLRENNTVLMSVKLRELQ